MKIKIALPDHKILDLIRRGEILVSDTEAIELQLRNLVEEATKVRQFLQDIWDGTDCVIPLQRPDWMANFDRLLALAGGPSFNGDRKQPENTRGMAGEPPFKFA